MADAAIDLGGTVIKGKRVVAAKECMEQGESAFLVALAIRAMQQFCFDDGTEGDRSGINGAETGDERRWLPLERIDPGIGIEQMRRRYHASRCSSVPCGGRSHGSSPAAPTN